MSNYNLSRWHGPKAGNVPEFWGAVEFTGDPVSPAAVRLAVVKHMLY